jgi:hypothetical protein
MTFRSCLYEKEVTEALKLGHWPEGCAPELREHVGKCATCGELILVSEAFRQARSDEMHATAGGSPGLIWWRAQLRRRNAAQETVSRPITIAQVLAFGVTLVIAVAFVASQYKHGLRWGAWWAEISPARVLHLLSIGSGNLNWNPLLLISGLGLLVLLSGIVAYLASEKS